LGKDAGALVSNLSTSTMPPTFGSGRPLLAFARASAGVHVVVAAADVLAKDVP